MAKLIIAQNKKVRFDYEILDTFEVGIMLTGAEVKSIRLRNVNINESFVIVKKGELFVLNMHIAKYEFSNSKFSVTNPDRTRKLLMHKIEILKILKRVQLEKLTIVPMSIYFKKGFVKLEIILGKGKKKYDKRQVIKKREVDRRINKKDYTNS